MTNIRQNNNVRLGGLFYQADFTSATKLDWVASHYDMISFVPSYGVASAISYLKNISSDIKTYIVLDPSVNTATPSYNGKYIGCWDNSIDSNFKLQSDAFGSATYTNYAPTAYYMDLGNPSYANRWSEKAVNLVGSIAADGIMLDEPYWSGKFFSGATYYQASSWSSAYGTYTNKVDGIFNLNSFITTLRSYISSYNSDLTLGIKSETLNDYVINSDPAWRWINYTDMVGYSDNFIYNNFNTYELDKNISAIPKFVNNIYSRQLDNSIKSVIDNLAFYLNIKDDYTVFQPGFATTSGYNLNNQIASYNSLYDLYLGTPLNNYFSIPSSPVIRRNYSNGLSIFNTSNTATCIVKLDGIFQSYQASSSIATSILAPLSGDIFLGNDSIIIDTANRQVVNKFAALTSSSAEDSIKNHVHTTNQIDLANHVQGTISEKNMEGVNYSSINGLLTNIAPLYHNGRFGERFIIQKDPMFSIDNELKFYKSINAFNDDFVIQVYKNGEIVDKLLYEIFDANTIKFFESQTALDTIEVVREAKTYLAENGAWDSNSQIIIYVNNVEVSSSTYTTNYATGLITFSSNKSIEDVVTADIQISNIKDVGSNTHQTIDDRIAEYDGFLDYNLSTTHEFNIAQRLMVLSASYGATSINPINYNIINMKELKYDVDNPGDGDIVGTVTIYNPTYPILPTYSATGIVEVKLASYMLAQSVTFFGDNLNKVYIPLGRYETSKDANYNFTVGLYNQSASFTPYQQLTSITKNCAFVDPIEDYTDIKSYEFDFNKFPVNKKEKYYITLDQSGGDDLNTITWFFRDPSYDYWGQAYFKYNGVWYIANNTDRDFILRTTSYRYSASYQAEDVYLDGIENYGNVSTYINIGTITNKYLAQKFKVTDISPTALSISLWHGLAAGVYKSANLSIHNDLTSLTTPIAVKNFPTIGGAVYNYDFPVGTLLNPGNYWLAIGSTSSGLPVGLCYSNESANYTAFIPSSSVATYSPSYSVMYEIHGYGNVMYTEVVIGGEPGDIATYIPSAVQMQSFTAQKNNINNVNLYLTKVGNPVNNIYITLENSDADDNSLNTYINIPTYKLNSSAVSNDGSFVKFNINNKDLTKGNKYILGLNIADAVTYDENNYISWDYGTEDYALGISEYKITPTYYKEPDRDRLFSYNYTVKADDDERKVTTSDITNNDLLGTTIKDIDVSIVLDNSGSMADNDPNSLRFDAVKDFITNMNRTYGDGVDFDLISFSYPTNYDNYGFEKYTDTRHGNTDILALLGNYNNITYSVGDLFNKIDALKFFPLSFSTPLIDTLIYAANRITSYKSEETNRYKAVVLFTDGLSNDDKHSYDEVVALFKALGISLYIIFLDINGDYVTDTNPMQRLATDTGNKIFYINDSSFISSILAYIKNFAVWSNNYSESTQDFLTDVFVSYVRMNVIVPDTTEAYYYVEYKKDGDALWTKFNDGIKLSPNTNITANFECRYIKYIVHLKAGSSPTVGDAVTGIIRANKEYLYSEEIDVEGYLNQIILSYADKVETTDYTYNFGIVLGNSETWSEYTKISKFNKNLINKRIHEETTTSDYYNYYLANGKWYKGSKVYVYTLVNDEYKLYEYPYRVNRAKGLIALDNLDYNNIYVTIVPPKTFKIGVEILSYDDIATPLNDFSVLFNTKNY